jgi:predicted GIY-YIG superfamily endonuclease
MSTLYILQLEHGKWYVGKTDDVSRRYSEHKSGKGSEWTKLHSPIKILETRQVKSDSDETNVTKDLMKKYGIDNVRGGAYCQRDLPEFVHKTIELEQKSSSDSCYKCGQKGHFAKNCIEEDEEYVWECDQCGCQFENEHSAEYHSKYCRVKQPSTQYPKKQSGNCYRCGRYGHYANQCYAKSTVEGDYLDSDDD